jgi:hypothetical protein
MEVHHHAHTSRKKWTHYFWNFNVVPCSVLRFPGGEHQGT